MIEIKDMETCEYCGNNHNAIIAVGEELQGFTNKIYVYVQGNKIRVMDEKDPGLAGETQIKDCPMCGRELEGEHETI